MNVTPLGALLCQKIDETGGENHSYRQDNVSKDVDIGGLNIDVSGFFSLPLGLTVGILKFLA